jgi:hypothetical protein
MTFLARSLALATALALLPGTALANPSTLAALQTVAVANDAGVAQALVQPAEPGTTQVTVVVSTTAGEPTAALPEAAEIAYPPTVAPTVAPTPPPPVYEPPPYSDRIYKDRKSGRSLLIGGITLGVTAYVYTSLAGALVIDKSRALHDDPLTMENEARHRADRRAYGKAMLIPGIGPALAIPKADTAMRAWAAGMAGLAQAAALTMTVVGIHRLGRARRFERLSWGAMAGSQQAHVSMSMRF